jgi:signal transduction histidine kinase
MGTNLELAADPELDPEALAFVNAARRAAERMAHTVDDLAGHGRLAVTAGDDPVNVSVLVNEMVSESSGPAHARGIRLIVAGSTQTMVPDADRAAVRSAAGNFVANAVRLAPRGSTVSLDWGEVPGWVWLAVGDEGPGLAPRHHARVFERGWRGRHDRDRDADGQAGLGLTIARQLTEAQGGVVTLESEEGAGSTFALWLPLSSGARAADVADPDGVHPAVRPWIRDLISS